MDIKKRLPPYMLIMEYLNDHIEKGEWAPGQQIPTEVNLMEQFGVSRMTVRRAIGELANAGKLETRQGLGTFVCTPKLDANYTNLFYPEYLGHTHRVLSCSDVPADADIAQIFHVAPGTNMYKIVRVRDLMDIPGMIEEGFVIKDNFPGLDNEDLQGRLQTVLLNKYGVQLTHLETIIEPVIADEQQAELLEIEPGAPCLLIHRYSYARNDLVLYSKNTIRGDKCRLRIG